MSGKDEPQNLDETKENKHRFESVQGEEIENVESLVGENPNNEQSESAPILEFICSIENCFKSFSKQSNLTKHENIEHKGFRYLCLFCDAFTKSKHSLQNHIKTMHPNKPQNYELNGAFFWTDKDGNALSHQSKLAKIIQLELKLKKKFKESEKLNEEILILSKRCCDLMQSQKASIDKNAQEPKNRKRLQRLLKKSQVPAKLAKMKHTNRTSTVTSATNTKPQHSNMPSELIERFEQPRDTSAEEKSPPKIHEQKEKDETAVELICFEMETSEIGAAVIENPVESEPEKQTETTNEPPKSDAVEKVVSNEWSREEDRFILMEIKSSSNIGNIYANILNAKRFPEKTEQEIRNRIDFLINFLVQIGHSK